MSISDNLKTILDVNDEEDDLETPKSGAGLPISTNYAKPPDNPVEAREANLELAKRNIKDISPVLAEGIQNMIQFSQTGVVDYVNSATALAKVFIAAQKTLADIEKIHHSIKTDGETPPPTNIEGDVVTNNNLNVFTGTTADLQKLVNKIKSEANVRPEVDET